jgi:chromosome segregation ATPase
MKRQQAPWILALTFSLVMALSLSPAWAAKKGGGGKGGGKGGQTAQPATPSPQQVQLATDQAALTTAQSDYTKALEALTTATNKLRLAFEQTSDWIAAKKQLTDAQGAMTDARKPVLAELAGNSEYATALDARNKAQADLDAVRSNPQDATPEALTPLAAALMEANSKVSKLENDALNANPNYTAAKDSVASAQAAVNALKTKFQESLASDADWKAAKDASDAAHQTLVDAQAKVAADQGGHATPPAAGTSAGA